MDVFADLELAHPNFSDTPTIAFLNTFNGDIVRPRCERELNDCLGDDRFVSFPMNKQNEIDRYGDVLDFVESLEDGVMRLNLDRLLTGRGALRRFKNFLHTEEGEVTKTKWQLFERECRYFQMVDWLNEVGIEWLEKS